MKKLLKLILIISFLNTTVCSNQHNYVFKHFSIENRLPGASVYCIYQDKKGLVWLGIESIGLCKYDGTRYTVYKNKETDTSTISNDFPLCIAEDSLGFLWVGTVDGLNRLDRRNNTFSRFKHKPGDTNSIPDNYITDLHVDRFNNLWIGTRLGMSKYIQSKNIFYNFLVGEGAYTDGLPALISDIYEDSDSNIWIGSYSSGLFLLEKKLNINHNKGIEKLNVSKHWFPNVKNINNDFNYSVQTICEFDENNLLIGKVDGLNLFNRSTEKFAKYYLSNYEFLDYDNISSIGKDNDGRIWIGFANKGLVFIDPNSKKMEFFSASDYYEGSIKGNSIRDIYIDKSGLVWIATKFKGIQIYDNRQEILNKHKYNDILSNKLNDMFILSVYEDPVGNIWVGTKSHGIFKFNPSTERIFNYSSKSNSGSYFISDNRIECINKDNNGTIWVGTSKGLQKLSGKNNSFLNYGPANIKCIAPDKKGNIWLGSNTSGLFYYDAVDNKTKRYHSVNEDRLFNDNTLNIKSLAISFDTLLWISTKIKGIYVYNIKTDKIIYSAIQLDDTTCKKINFIFVDKSDQIWLASETKGLIKYNVPDHKFSRHYPANSNLPHNISNITEDNSGNLWIGSHMGIYKLDKVSGKSNLYDNKYGLKSIVSQINALYLTHDNLIIHGGSEGINVFEPDKVLKNSYFTPLIITSVKAYDRILAEDVIEPEELEIRYNQKFISIEFALADYTAPMETGYRYMMENFDEDWIECGINNIATYTALPPGRYIFKVMTTGLEPQVCSINLIVKGPIWHQPYFIGLSIIIFIIIVVLVHLTRLKILKKNEIRLNEIVREKTFHLMELNQQLEENKSKLEEAMVKALESDKLKTAFLANLSHEIRTPMNGIMGFIDLLKNNNTNTTNLKKYINIIESSGNRLLNIMSNLIDISRIEADQIILEYKKFNFDIIFNEVVENYSLNAKSKNISLIKRKEVASDDDCIIIGDKNRIAQILSNLLDNALKYTNKGEIRVGYRIDKDNLILYVEDSGQGIPYDKQDIIFEPFRKAEDLEMNFTDGSGLGLAISKAIIEMHGGKIWVNSIYGEGSSFYLSLPVMK